MSGLVLVTGGTGKTGSRLVRELRECGVPHRVASRRTVAAEGATPFDWTRPESWDRALEGVASVYLVAPATAGDPAQTMIDFLRLAIARGASRFVLLSASLLPAGGPAMGKVHGWLRENAQEWTALRPSWFMQNFSEGQHLATIRNDDCIYSATGDGRVPFVSADDIAKAALVALTRESAFNADFILTSGRAIAYGEVAERIGKAVGRPISHRRLGVDELAARHLALGMAPLAARTLASMDLAIAAGAEDRVTDCVEFLTGRPPTAFEAFVEANAVRWSVDRRVPP
jgi:ergot alkaloid biosynthesis protein